MGESGKSLGAHRYAAKSVRHKRAEVDTFLDWAGGSATGSDRNGSEE